MQEIKLLEEKYLNPKYPLNVGVIREDIEYFNALKELGKVEDAQALEDRLASLSKLIQEADDEDEVTEDGVQEPPEEGESGEGQKESEEDEDPDNPALKFDTDPEEDPEELGDEEETFSNKYPDADGGEILKQAYDDWIQNINQKPFYKVIEGFYEQKQAGSLNFLERNFLWKFMKAISSAITHLLIEGELKEESIYLVQKYFDSLVACLDKVVHAADKEDVIQAFDYMVEFLGILSEDDQEEASEGDEF